MKYFVAPLMPLKHWTLKRCEKEFYRQRYCLDTKVRTSLPVDDYDRFPFQVWKKSHRKSYIHDSVYSETKRGLRWYGYVLRDFPAVSDKDLSRLARLGTSRSNEPISREQEDMILHSFTERKEILDRGGRGYWSAGDTSHIVWLDGVSQPTENKTP